MVSEELLAALIAGHQPYESEELDHWGQRYQVRQCGEDGDAWPCPTAQLLEELDAWRARAEGAEAALLLAERHARERWKTPEGAWSGCVICDRAVLGDGHIDHAPDCPFADVSRPSEELHECRSWSGVEHVCVLCGSALTSAAVSRPD